MDKELCEKILKHLIDSEHINESDKIELPYEFKTGKGIIELKYSISMKEFPCIHPDGVKATKHKPIKPFGVENWTCTNCGKVVPQN